MKTNVESLKEKFVNTNLATWLNPKESNKLRLALQKGVVYFSLKSEKNIVKFYVNDKLIFQKEVDGR